MLSESLNPAGKSLYAVLYDAQVASAAASGLCLLSPPLTSTAPSHLMSPSSLAARTSCSETADLPPEYLWLFTPDVDVLVADDIRPKYEKKLTPIDLAAAYTQKCCNGDCLRAHVSWNLLVATRTRCGLLADHRVTDELRSYFTATRGQYQLRSDDGRWHACCVTALCRLFGCSPDRVRSARDDVVAGRSFATSPTPRTAAAAPFSRASVRRKVAELIAHDVMSCIAMPSPEHPDRLHVTCATTHQDVYNMYVKMLEADPEHWTADIPSVYAATARHALEYDAFAKILKDLCVHSSCGID
jgi:hypothetical protein